MRLYSCFLAATFFLTSFSAMSLGEDVGPTISLREELQKIESLFLVQSGYSFTTTDPTPFFRDEIFSRNEIFESHSLRAADQDTAWKIVADRLKETRFIDSSKMDSALADLEAGVKVGLRQLERESRSDFQVLSEEDLMALDRMAKVVRRTRFLRLPTAQEVWDSCKDSSELFKCAEEALLKGYLISDETVRRLPSGGVFSNSEVDLFLKRNGSSRVSNVVQSSFYFGTESLEVDREDFKGATIGILVQIQGEKNLIEPGSVITSKTPFRCVNCKLRKNSVAINPKFRAIDQKYTGQFVRVGELNLEGGARLENGELSAGQWHLQENAMLLNSTVRVSRKGEYNLVFLVEKGCQISSSLLQFHSRLTPKEFVRGALDTLAFGHAPDLPAKNLNVEFSKPDGVSGCVGKLTHD
jgi:hypothetical protein